MECRLWKEQRPFMFASLSVFHGYFPLPLFHAWGLTGRRHGSGGSRPSPRCGHSRGQSQQSPKSAPQDIWRQRHQKQIELTCWALKQEIISEAKLPGGGDHHDGSRVFRGQAWSLLCYPTLSFLNCGWEKNSGCRRTFCCDDQVKQNFHTKSPTRS